MFGGSNGMLGIGLYKANTISLDQTCVFLFYILYFGGWEWGLYGVPGNKPRDSFI